MKKNTLSLLLVLLSAAAARGQIGSDAGRRAALFGDPVQSVSNATGLCVVYRINGWDITAHEIEGRALRLIYRKEAFDYPDIRWVLTQNRDEAEWESWKPPRSGEPVTDAWYRSDNQAMAVLKGNECVVTAAAWNRYAPAPEPAGPPAASAAAGPAPAPAGPVPAADASPAGPGEGRFRPARPADLPKPGETREAVIGKCGRPKGEIRSGSQEILLFPWGDVTLESGAVLAVE